LLLIGAGTVVLYYTEAGRGKENDAALLPDRLEGRIDLVVATLNKQFGKWWVDRALDVLRFYLRKTLPPELVALLSAIYQVELLSRSVPMKGYVKRQQAMALLK
jgi:hypothetical protein